MVTDVGEDAPEHRQRRLRSHWRNHTGLGHRAEQSHRLEQHGFAPRVGAAHQNRGFRLLQHEVERHRVARLGEQQRVQTLPDCRGRRRLAEPRKARLGRERVPGARVTVIRGHAHAQPVLDLRCERPRLLGEGSQHRQRFPSLLGLAGVQVVAQLHGLGRFHEQRRARAGLPVHDALHPPTALGAHWDHVATAAQRHFRLPLARREVAQLPLQHGDEPFARIAQPPPRPLERGRRPVLYPSVGFYGTLDGLLQASRRDLHGERRHARCVLVEGSELARHLPHGGEARLERVQLGAVEHAPVDGELLQHLGEIGDRQRLEATPLVQLAGELPRGGELLSDELHVGEGLTRTHRRRSQIGHGVLRHHTEHAIELQLGEGLGSCYPRE